MPDLPDGEHMAESQPWFDAHMHIFNPQFPMKPNAGYLPEPFTTADYLARVQSLPRPLAGGVVVSASTQGFDQTYLRAALARLGLGWVGVTQVPPSVSDAQLEELAVVGVRGIRFNLFRGGRALLADLEVMARRVYDLVGWHVELYVDSRDLEELRPRITALPKVSIDHLGLFGSGLSNLLKLVDAGVRVKASGFGRIDFDAAAALEQIHRANPEALMFGTDLPSPRARRPFMDADFILVSDLFRDPDERRVLHDNAVSWYRPTSQLPSADATDIG